MESENPYSGEFVPSRCPPCFRAFDYSPNEANSMQSRASHARLLARRNNDATDSSPPPPYADGLNQLAHLDVHNFSLNPQGFVIYPSAPTISSPTDVKIRIRVFQACKRLQANGGAMRFQLPCGSPLNWGNAEAQPGIIVIAGSRSPGEDSAFGRKAGTVSVPYGNHFKLLSTGPINGKPAQNFCVLSVPIDSEAFILSDAELKKRNYVMPTDLEEGAVQIMTDDLAGTGKDVIAYAGIGAVNPKYPRDIVPIVTWDVGPNLTYRVTADMRTWHVAALSDSEPGAAIDSSAMPPSMPVTFAAASDHDANVYYQPGNVFET
ncbi:hypothetical protein LX32DRAFT_641655 [Colletotrichum zoysiae]|uniref:Uncharacterized protein n=1 Tax=Colletotrichum zoysiae TaxID=1216348 RepID=A0AAD9HE28_9PEZI|nr:hypothetical protein LX32DRAFT_641655 [Colletotrichum zoysiae]